MKNTMIINGYRAVIGYDPDIEMFPGYFIGLNGEADFFGSTGERSSHLTILSREYAVSEISLELPSSTITQPTRFTRGPAPQERILNKERSPGGSQFS